MAPVTTTFIAFPRTSTRLRHDCDNWRCADPGRPLASVIVGDAARALRCRPPVAFAILDANALLADDAGEETLAAAAGDLVGHHLPAIGCRGFARGLCGGSFARRGGGESIRRRSTRESRRIDGAFCRGAARMRGCAGTRR